MQKVCATAPASGFMCGYNAFLHNLCIFDELLLEGSVENAH